jgi:hypothetical protein
MRELVRVRVRVRVNDAVFNEAINASTWRHTFNEATLTKTVTTVRTW